MKNLLIFGAGFVAGGSYILWQISTEKLLVSHNPEGGVTIRTRAKQPDVD